nr:unnamed protein product [Callosobruchus analis]
MEGRSS